jgi:hypothetical protein
MSRNVRVDIKGLEQFRDRLEQFSDEQVQIFITSCAKELAARLLAKVIKRTPVGEYGKSIMRDDAGEAIRLKSGKNKGKVKKQVVKKGGTLRRGWTAKTEAEAESGTGRGADAIEYANSLVIRKVDNAYTIEVINPVHYASYVEFGHRTANHKGWVEGKFMLTISEQELEADAPRVIENKLNKYLGECFK